MRILQVSPVPREQGGITTGGIATHAWGLSVRLAARGHDVAVLAHNREYGEPWPETFSGVQVYGGRGFSGRRRTRQLVRPSTVRAILAARRRLGPGWKLPWIVNSVCAARETIEEFGPDVIHVHSIESRFAVTLEADTEGIPIIGIPHSTHYVEYAEGDVQRAHRRAAHPAHLAVAHASRLAHRPAAVAGRAAARPQPPRRAGLAGRPADP